jgi:hypothetical protein
MHVKKKESFCNVKMDTEHHNYKLVHPYSSTTFQRYQEHNMKCCCLGNFKVTKQNKMKQTTMLLKTFLKLIFKTNIQTMFL